MINEIQPWIGHEPSQKIHAEYLTGKSESAQGFFEQWLPLRRPESSNLSLRTQDSIRQNLSEKGNTVWTRKKS